MYVAYCNLLLIAFWTGTSDHWAKHQCYTAHNLLKCSYLLDLIIVVLSRCRFYSLKVTRLSQTSLHDYLLWSPSLLYFTPWQLDKVQFLSLSTWDFLWPDPNNTRPVIQAPRYEIPSRWQGIYRWENSAGQHQHLCHGLACDMDSENPPPYAVAVSNNRCKLTAQHMHI